MAEHAHAHNHGGDHGGDDLLAEVFDGGPPDDYEILEIALRELLIAKGVIGAEELRAKITEWDAKTPEIGARLVARAWLDPGFRARLVEDVYAATAELGIDTSGPRIVVLEDTPEVHHVVVCTLCSCYPRAVLGMPPAWYKGREYRSRVVADPRGVLKEFGTEIDPSIEVRVVDNTAECRYLVLPLRPAGSEGLPEEQLRGLVTRDSMIGVTLPLAP